MRTSDLFPNKFVSSADLKGKTRILTIQDLKVEEVGQERERRGVLYFEGDQKPLILNKTNFSALEEGYGDSENWAGQPVELFSIPTTYLGKPTQGLRVRVPAEPDANELVDDSSPPLVTAGAKGGKKKPAELEGDPRPEPPDDDDGGNSGGGGNAPVDLDDEIPFAPLRDLP